VIANGFERVAGVMGDVRSAMDPDNSASEKLAGPLLAGLGTA
jgi:hypothetical protein